MKKNLFLAMLMSMLTLPTLTSCGDDEDNSVSLDVNAMTIETGSTAYVNEDDAKLLGYVNTNGFSSMKVAANVKFGFQVSTRSSFIDAEQITGYRETSNSNNFYGLVFGLNSGTKYYYRAFVCIQSVSAANYGYIYGYKYGNTKSFTTKNVENNNSNTGNTGNNDDKEEQTMISGHEYVDFGLSSGTLWATMNIGASKPEYPGSFFAWGETNAKSNFNSNTYFDSTYKTYRVGVRNVLETSNDAAYKKWGGNWRIPTKKQWEELKSSCSWQWTSLNGYKGYRVSKGSKSIFLPATGFYEYSTLKRSGEVGTYWSRNLHYQESQYAYYFSFNSSSKEIASDYRWFGQSIRAVYEKW